jgi:hypothetical protein
METLAIPLWGQLSIMGLSLGLNVFFITQLARGLLVPYNRVEAEQKNTDRWQHAWEIGDQSKHEATDLAKQLLVVGQSMEKVLNALPPAGNGRATVPRGSDDGGA